MGGWEESTVDWHDRRAVATTHSTGRLALFAGAPRDRRVTIDAARGGGTWKSDAVPRLVATLGGARIDLGRLAGPWREFSFVAPSELWSEGRNELLLEVEQGDSIERRMLHIARVRTNPLAGASDSASAQGRDGVGLGLGPGDAVRAQLAGVDGATVEVSYRAGGRGELIAELRPVDPWTAELGPPVFDEVIYVEATEGARQALELPDEAPDLAQLELRWRPSDELGSASLTEVTVHRPRPAPPELIVFLSIDTLAALNMSLHGYGRETTPVLDELAERAVVFDRCSANGTWTVPSYVAQLTALLPTTHEPGANSPNPATPSWTRFSLADERLTMAEVMNAAGYETRAIVDNPFLAQLPGVRQGFEQLDIRPTRRPIRDTEGGMQLVSETVLEWIDEWDRERPLFVFMQVLDVHGPYMTTPPWDEAFGQDPARGPLLPIDHSKIGAFGAIDESIAAGARSLGFEGEGVAPVGALLDAYDEKILEMDARIGQFLEALAERGLRDDALLVISADHGESTVQRGQFFKHGPIYEPSAHVPLIIDLPGETGGRRIDTRVQLVDLLPTLAELVGLDPDPFAFHGRSIAPLIRGEELPRRPVIVQTTYLEQRAVLVDRWKLVASTPGAAPDLASVLTYPQYWTLWAEAHPQWAQELAGRNDVEQPPRYDAERFRQFSDRHPDATETTRAFFRGLGRTLELFDLEADPRETTDLAAREPAVVAELTRILAEAELMAWESRIEADPADAIGDLSPEVMAELEALGYVHDE